MRGMRRPDFFILIPEGLARSGEMAHTLSIRGITEEEIRLPNWLSHQIMRAFHKRDRRQIRLLNDCWFFYYNRQYSQDKNVQ